jgi:hypothetical protein
MACPPRDCVSDAAAISVASSSSNLSCLAVNNNIKADLLVLDVNGWEQSEGAMNPPQVTTALECCQVQIVVLEFACVVTKFPNFCRRLTLRKLRSYRLAKYIRAVMLGRSVIKRKVAAVDVLPSPMLGMAKKIVLARSSSDRMQAVLLGENILTLLVL